MPGTAVEDLAALIICLQEAVEEENGSRFIRLRAELFPAAGELARCFGPQAADLRIEQRDNIPMVQPDPPEAPEMVRVVGSARPFPHGAQSSEFEVTVTGTVPEPGAPLLRLEARPAADDWEFAHDFPTFPAHCGVDGPGTAWKDSYFTDLKLSHAVLSASSAEAGDLKLAATLSLSDGALQPLTTVLPAESVELKGKIRPRDDAFPLVKLAGPVPDYHIDRLVEPTLEFGTSETGGPGDHGESTLFLRATTRLGDMPELTLSVPPLQGSATWVLTGAVVDPDRYSLAAGLQTLVEYAGGGQQLTLPQGLDMLGSLHLESVTIAVAVEKTPRIDSIGFRVASAPGTRWTAPILGLTLSDFAVEWYVASPFDAPYLMGEVTGVLHLGDTPDAPRLDTQVDLSGLDTAFAPDVSVSAELDSASPVHLDQLFRRFTGLDLGVDLRISAMMLRAQTGPRTLQFTATLDGAWPTPLPMVEFQNTQFLFRYGPSGFSGSVQAAVELAGFPFFALADYRGEGKGWRFAGGLRPEGQPANLQKLVDRVAGERYPRLPGGLGDIELRRLLLSFDTATQEFTFDGVAGWTFRYLDLGFTPDIEAELSLVSRPKSSSALTAPSERVYGGFARGTLLVNDFSVTVIYSFDVEQNKTLSFAVRYRKLTLLATVSKNERDETVLRAGLSGVSFGDILDYLVGLVDPQLGFRLATPWDVLYQLRFDDLSLEVNLTTKEVGIRYAPKLDLGIARVDAISLTYLTRAGTSTVDIAIEGEFLGQGYGEKDPLTWDLLNDPAPAPPGKADQLLDLRFLGIGQNIAFRDTATFRRVRDVVEAMEAGFDEVSGDHDPLESLPALKFSGNGSWLVGADFTLMGAVSLMGVFADPTLYGLRIGLAGEKVKQLAGLDFEILYKKVTDTVGVYSMELTLPDAMRQLQFGAVSVTVPIIGIDIYTNGNFRLDLGFPAKGDFSRSFCVQAGPFIGYGGFYFALLNGDTSSAVPRVRNGSFTPVIEAGLGLSVGVGRTVEKGVLRGGATLTVQAVIEGVLGWFNPDDRSRPSDLFYRLQGTASIVGKVFGEVDFAVVKARVSVTAYAAVTLTLQAYEPIDVRLELAVEVSASVTVLFIDINFSFEAKLDLSFQIGHRGNPPWLLAAEDPHEHPLRLGVQRRRLRASASRPLDLFHLMQERTGETPQFDWSPRAVFADGKPVDVDVLLVPSLTPAVSSRVTHALRARPETPTSTPAIQVVMSLVVPTSTPAGALHAAEVLRVEGDGAADAAFNRLAAGTLRWAISSLRTSPDAQVFRARRTDGSVDVTSAALEAIGRSLADRDHRESIFTYERVVAMIEQNFVLRLSNPIGPTGAFHDPGRDEPRPTDTPSMQGAVFPMIPEVRMAPQGLPATDFWQHNCADDDYRAFLSDYYDQLTPPLPPGTGPDHLTHDASTRPGPTGLASGPPSATSLPPGCADGREPVSAILFADYFAMMTQQAVQSAADLMSAYPYEPTGGETLLEVAQAFGGFRVEYATRPGDSVTTVAATFGTSVDDVRRLNDHWLRDMHAAEQLPHGSVLAVEIGPTVARIAGANADYPLRQGALLTVHHARHAVRSRETLTAIAQSFGLDGASALLTGAGAANAHNPGLLRVGAGLPIPATDYRVEADDLIVPEQAVDRIAARHFVRAGSRSSDPDVDARVAWYTSAITRLNVGGVTGTVQIPVAESVAGSPQLRDTGNQTPYVVDATDTVTEMAAIFELLQVDADDEEWRAFREQVTVSPPSGPVETGSVVHLPGLSYRVSAGDTLEDLTRRFLAPRAEIAPPETLAAMAESAGAADVLAPRTVLVLPDVRYRVQPDDTLTTVARRFDQTVEEVADSAKSDPGILTPYDGRLRLEIPDVASRDLDDLIDDLTRFGRFNTLSTALSRFLLNGMRAPLPPSEGPVRPDAPLWGLYDVAGQQFPAPAATGPYQIEFSKAPGSGATWFGFEAPVGRRRAVAAGDERVAGGDSLTVMLPAGFFTKHAPSIELDPLMATGPAPMPLYDEAATRHPMEQVVPWLPATHVPLPGPTGPSGPSGQTGSPTLWMFPKTLLRETAGPTGATGSTRPYELLAARDTTGGGTVEDELTEYSWATAVPLRITRARDDGDGFVPGTYDLAGSDPDGLDRLLKAWRYLDASPGHPDRLYLLYSPGDLSTNRHGLVSDPLVGGRTLLLKTNLSTETHSGALAAAAVAGDYYAALDTPAAFLRYAWEAGVTGTGGFHLTYSTTDGAALPDSLFAADGSATVWVVLLLDRQSRPGTAPDRSLYPFNNCAVLAENLDASAIRVVARVHDPAPGDLRRVAAVPPGVVGFGLARHSPHSTSGPTGLTQRLHSLVGYQVRSNDEFSESHEGLPIGPQDRTPAWMRLPDKGPTAHAYWTYEQVIPIARFGTENQCPRSPALPAADANPYRGVTGPAPGASGPLGSARLGLAYHDVYGNETTTTRPLPDLDLPVGYTDELIGPLAWPGAAFDYRFAPGPAGAIELDTRLSLDFRRYLPGADIDQPAAVRAATTDTQRYAQIFYQVQQRDVDFSLTGNLGTPRVDEPGRVKAPLLSFAVKAHTFAAAARTMRQRAHTTAGGQTLAALSETLAVTPDALLIANRDVDAAALFPATWVRPHLVPAPAMNTLLALAQEASSRRTGFDPGTDPCGGPTSPDPARGSHLASLRLVLPGEQARSERAAARGLVEGARPDPGVVASDNAAQPLTPGSVLVTRSRTSPPLDPDVGADSIDGAARWLGCAAYAQVPDPEEPHGAPLRVGLVIDNWDTTGIVADGVKVSVGRSEHTTRDDTLGSLYAALVAQAPDVTRDEFASTVRAVAGLLEAHKTLTYATLVVPQPPPSPLPGPAVPVFALRDIPADAGTPSLLGDLNRATPGFFVTGSPLLVGFECCTATEHDTPGTLAEDARISLAQLAQYNLGVVVGSGVELEVPGLVELPDPDEVWASYTPGSTDSLISVAAMCGSDVRTFAATNRELPGVFAPGATVRIDGVEHRATPMDSLQSMWRRFTDAGEFEAWIDKLAPLAGIYSPSGAFLGAVPRVPDGGDGHSPTLEAVAGGLNLTVTELLTGNRSLAGVLREGAEIRGPRRADGGPTSVTVGAWDTVETVRRRLREELGSGAPAPSDDELAAINADRPGLLHVGAPLLPPPTATSLVVPVDATLPPDTGERSVVFPVEVSVVMTRSPGLIHPDFRSTDAVHRCEAGLAPRLTNSPRKTTGTERSSDEDGARSTLVPFARSLEQAYAAHTLKCAVVAGEGQRPDGFGEVWAVNFGPSGIRRVDLDAVHPNFYALRPLSTQTVSGDVMLPVYTSGFGLCGRVPKRYDEVALDGWMRQLLDTIDLYLTPPYSVPAFRLGLTGAAPRPGPAPRPAAPAPAEWLTPVAPTGPVGLMSGDSSPALEHLAEPVTVTGPTGCTGPRPNGPADFDRIMAAKESLAASLRRAVMPVLQTPGATGAAEHEAAREALYQQMLVRLGSAYDVSSVVQFPVDVESPLIAGPSGPFPPRACGKVVPTLFTVPDQVRDATDAPDSYEGVASAFGMAAPFLAQITGDQHGLLRPGCVLDGEVVGPEDTLNRIAGRRDVPIDPTAPGYWATWQTFVETFATEPVFAPGTAFPLSRAARVAGENDDFTVAAEFFGCGLGSLARANQSLPGILRSGRLVVDGTFDQPYEVKDTDTLVDIADGVSRANGGLELPVEQLVTLLRDRVVLRPGIELHMADRLPEMSISTAKLSLGPAGASGGRTPLTFLLTAKHTTERDKLLLNLNFAINEIEYAIRDVPGAGRYQASRWLTLVLPLDGADGGIDAGVRTAIPQMQVPIPLRAYPPAPRLLAQSGTGSEPEAVTFDRARMWNYRADVQTHKAAQDTDHLRFAFGDRRNVRSQADVSPDLFTWLAAFAEAYPRLSDDLARLPGLEPGADDPVAAYAVQSLSVLAQRVAAALGAGTHSLDAPAGADDIYRYRMTTMADDAQLRTLRLDREVDGPGFRTAPAPSGPVGLAGTWPTMFVKSTTGGGETGPEPGFLPMRGDAGLYTFPPGFRLDEKLTYRFRFDDRDVIRNATGRGAIAVSRNDRLVAHGPLGPSGSGDPVPTCSDFVYRTPFVEFIDPLVPLIDNDAAIHISEEGAEPQPLNDLVLSMLAQATDVTPAGGDPQIVELLCSYGFPMVATNDGPLVATTPILLVPARTVSPTTVHTFAREVSTSLDEWHRATRPTGDRPRLIFALSVFTTGADGEMLPTLRLRNLHLPLSSIRWNAQ